MVSSGRPTDVASPEILLQSCARCFLAILLLATSIASTSAGIHPFQVETALLLPEGIIELEAGLRAASGARRVIFPLEEGRDLGFPTVGLRAGLGSRAEWRIEGEVLRRFEPDRGASVSGAGDWSVATKIRLGRKNPRWAWAAWFGAKLPVASDNEGLGTNLTDLDFRALLTGHAGKGILDLNGGVAILGAPFRERAQIDLMTYAMAYRIPWTETLEAGFEFAGREGGDFFGALSSLRAGLRWQRPKWRLEGSIAAGLTETSPSTELRLGIAMRFDRKHR